MRHNDGAVRNFNMLQFVFLHQLYIILQLVAYQKCFQQRSAKIKCYARTFIECNFFIEMRGNIGSSKAQLQQVYIVTAYRKHVLCFAQTQPFIHYHSQPMISWLDGALGNLVKVKIHRVWVECCSTSEVIFLSRFMRGRYSYN